MQGNRSTEAAGRVIDLDAQLAVRMLDPVPVRLGGHVYEVRTDLTPREATQALAAFRATKDTEGWALLLGEADAKRLDEYLDDVPKQKVDLITHALMRASVVLAGHTVNLADALTVDVPDAGEDGADKGGSSAS